MIINGALIAACEFFATGVHFLNFTRNDLKECRAIGIQLFRPYSVDFSHFVEILGTLLRHFDQGFIIENDIGGNIGLFCQKSPLGL